MPTAKGFHVIGVAFGNRYNLGTRRDHNVFLKTCREDTKSE